MILSTNYPRLNDQEVRIIQSYFYYFYLFSFHGRPADTAGFVPVVGSFNYMSIFIIIFIFFSPSVYIFDAQLFIWLAQNSRS